MLTLICGLSRAGKTTYSTKYSDVIHWDNFANMPSFVRYEKCAKRAKTTDNIVIEGIYDKAKYRKDLVDTYEGKYTKCIWLNTSYEIRCQRGKWFGSSDLPFEPPTLDEGWDEIIIISGENDIKHITKE